MKVVNVKQYSKFLDKCETNASVHLTSHHSLTFSILVQHGAEKSVHSLGRIGADFREKAENFVSNLVHADSIIIQIEHEQVVMQAHTFSFTVPPQQASNMPEANEAGTILSGLSKQEQMLGTILQLTGKVELESVKNEYERRLQALEFDKREMKAKNEALEEQKKQMQADFELREKRYKAKLENSKTEITNYQSEEKTLGNINLIKSFGKELASAVMLFGAANTDNDKKEAKFMSMAGILSGLSTALPAENTEQALAFIAEHHDEMRKDAQRALFEYIDSLEIKSFEHVNNMIAFTANTENTALFNKYIIPLISGTLTE